MTIGGKLTRTRHVRPLADHEEDTAQENADLNTYVLIVGMNLAPGKGSPLQ